MRKRTREEEPSPRGGVESNRVWMCVFAKTVEEQIRSTPLPTYG